LHQQADALQKQYFTTPHLPNIFDIWHLDFHWKLEIRILKFCCVYPVK